MRLDASDFEAVWQHMCARALADHAQGTLIASFIRAEDRSCRRHERPYGREGVLSRTPVSSAAGTATAPSARAPRAPTSVSSTAAHILREGDARGREPGMKGRLSTPRMP